MVKVKIAKFYKCVMLLCILFAAPLMGYASSPDDFVRGLSDRLLTELEKNQSKLSGNSELAYSIARKVIMPKVDVQGMSRSVLGRKIWTKMNGGQKRDFTKTFTNLIMKTYSKSLTGYDGDKIKVLPLGSRYKGKSRVVIKSFLIRENGQKIALKYRMISKGGTWKIYDVSVEGISLLQNFRTQFSAELSRGTIDELITKMKKN